MCKEYNFNIIFNKLEENKKEQGKLYFHDFVISKEISDEIQTLKEFYEGTSDPELETYTRT